jgi:molybdate/tungstate transport system substrate-binding protein
MEKQIGPAFSTASGDGFQGYGSDSQSIANAIKGRVKTGDVFICANPIVDATLVGASNGDWVRWYATFATAPLVLGYSPQSKFASALRARPWYQVLQEPGIRIGVTDPKLDPKGKLTVAALATAQKLFQLPSTFTGSIEKKAVVFPEQDLLGRLESGQLDVGFFYTSESMPAHLHTVSLGKVHEGARYTVTVLQNAPDAGAGTAFVRYLLTTARPVLDANGLTGVRPTVSGRRSAVPPSLRAVLNE